MRRGLTRDMLVLDYQPRHCMRSGRTLAVEALPRWPHRLTAAMGASSSGTPERHSGRLVGGWLLQTACTEARLWNRPDLRLSVKLIGPQLTSEELCIQVSAALEESGLPPECLELAIPESVAFSLDEDAAIAFASLRDIGVNLLLDEFGHVFASLLALRDMPLTAMKVDRLMLRSLPSDQETLAVVRAAVETSHAMGLSVCADGVDTDAHRLALQGLTIDEGQGGVFSPPLSAAEIRLYLQR
jgi:EAL domain-containing protein (putative c-di-GMP-specific phosphodiesterase class I)